MNSVEERMSRIEGVSEQLDKRFEKTDKDIADIRSGLWRIMSFGFIVIVALLTHLFRLFLVKPSP